MLDPLDATDNTGRSIGPLIVQVGDAEISRSIVPGSHDCTALSNSTQSVSVGPMNQTTVLGWCTSPDLDFWEIYNIPFTSRDFYDTIAGSPSVINLRNERIGTSTSLECLDIPNG